jgi:hypothetical protein
MKGPHRPLTLLTALVEGSEIYTMVWLSTLHNVTQLLISTITRVSPMITTCLPNIYNQMIVRPNDWQGSDRVRATILPP